MPPDRRFPFQGPRPYNGKGSHPPRPQSQQEQPRSTPQEPPPQKEIPAPPAPDPNPFHSLLRRLDGDTLLILAVLLLLSKEHKDRRLLLALAYIIL